MDAAIAETKLAGKATKRYVAWVQQVKAIFNDLRDAAKAVGFGIIYGKSAFSLARDISKTGRVMSVEDCELLIQNGYVKAFPRAWAWLGGNAASAIDRGFVETAFGRRRYFPGIQSMPEKDQKAAQREAKNSPIQGLVADLLAVAGVNLYRMRFKTDIGQKIGFRVVLPIHDAFLVEVRNEYVTEMKAIIKLCMSTLNKIPGTNKSLGVSLEKYPLRWGEAEVFGHSA